MFYSMKELTDKEFYVVTRNYLEHQHEIISMLQKENRELKQKIKDIKKLVKMYKNRFTFL